jgi:hypothetical protein
MEEGVLIILSEDRPSSLRAERDRAEETIYSSRREALIENSKLRISKIQIIMIKIKKSIFPESHIS